MLTTAICAEIEERYELMLQAVESGDFDRAVQLQHEIDRLRSEAEASPSTPERHPEEVEALRARLVRILELDRQIGTYLAPLHDETKKLLLAQRRDRAVRSAYQASDS
ncbi:flagellar protein FliT [Thauera sp.]|uniref:flagellar protein FliT n=1 Tax=Thauera sp. TaxID=1905334 RepID=UPI002579FA30|nr:flagellar protein FliT [Thauera sp.]